VYTVITYSDVLEQIAALPTDALSFYAEAFGLLELVPWNGRPYNEDKPDRPMRELVFGAHGEGTITYLILEQQREVHVILVQYVG
jgi:hypothetical protein